MDIEQNRIETISKNDIAGNQLVEDSEIVKMRFSPFLRQVS